MLVEFQRALADLTASPELCREVRREPAILRQRYQLTEREWRRLTAIAGSRGMEANCVLYRANRLAPIALNLPDTCKALGETLTQHVSAYWDSEPITDVHFLVEADRFGQYLRRQPGLDPAVASALEREHGLVAGKLAFSSSHTGTSPWPPRS
jgi:hypothetical protein